jgi:hypothetical protein
VNVNGHPWFGAGVAEIGRDGVRRVAESMAADMEGLPFSIGGATTPIVVPAHSYDELMGAAERLLRLLERAGMGVAPDRAGRLLAHGVDEEAWPLFWDDDELERRWCACISRADILVGPQGPRFLEFNVSGAVGGVTTTHVLTRSWQRAYAGSAGVSLDGPDPLAARAALYESMCAGLGARPAVAVVAAPHTMWADPAAGARYLDVEVRFLRGRGIVAEHFEPERLLDGLGLPGRLRFATGLRYMTIPEWREHGVSLEPLRAALDAGCRLLSPQSSYFVADKKVFAWLSEGQPWMSDEDRAFVARYVPWTRVVADTATTWRGRRHDLLDLLLRERERFVLKEAFGMMGLGMSIGRDCSDGGWSDAVARAVGGDMIAQELVEGAFCEVGFADGGDRSEPRPVRPVLSPIVIGGRGAGCFVRCLPPDISGDIVSASRHGAIRNVVFRGA